MADTKWLLDRNIGKDGRLGANEVRLHELRAATSDIRWKAANLRALANADRGNARSASDEMLPNMNLAMGEIVSQFCSAWPLSGSHVFRE